MMIGYTRTPDGPPVRGFADLDSYCAGLGPQSSQAFQLSGAELSMPLAPRFIFGELPGQLAATLFGEFHSGPVMLRVLSDAAVTADGIVVHGGTALSSMMLNHPDYHVRDVVNRLQLDRRTMTVRRFDRRAVMMSAPGYTIWGHWLVDILPRLFVLHRAGYDIRDLDYILPTAAPNFAVQLLSLAGIPESRLVRYSERNELLEVAELILPANVRRGSRVSPILCDSVAAYVSWVAQGHPIQRAESSPRKIFISRRGAHPSRHLANRDSIEAIAAEAGFAIIVPADFSITDQIALFQGARQVIGEYGSGLHSCMFAPTGTAICAIRSTSNHPGFIQSGIAQAMRQHIGYLFGLAPWDAVDQEFSVDESDFLRCIQALDMIRPTTT